MSASKLDSTTSSTSPSQQQQQQPPKHKLSVEDSGHFDSGYGHSDPNLSGYLGEKQPEIPHPTPPPPPQQHPLGELSQKQRLVDTYSDSGVVEGDEEQNAEAEQMLLERGLLDNGVAERLYNDLSPKVDSATASLDQMNISDAPKHHQQQKNKKDEEFFFEVPGEEQPWVRAYIQDTEGDTYLHMAVSEGSEAIVRDLIRITPLPCFLDIQNDLLQSALHVAVLTGNVRIVRMLLLAGAESSIRDKNGNAPIHLACAAADLDCLRALTERITATEQQTAVSCSGALVPATKLKRMQHLVQYADVELRNYDGEHCVHIAAAATGTEKNKHVDVMRELVLRSGANVNAREGKAGYTALHMAVERGDRDLVKFLLDECKSVNLEVASYGRWTAYQIARVNRDQELMAMLRSKGAEPLDVSSSEESDDDSDLEETEILDMYGAATGGFLPSASAASSFLPLVGY